MPKFVDPPFVSPVYEERVSGRDDHERFLLPGSPGTGRGIGRTGTGFEVCDPWHQFGSQKRGASNIERIYTLTPFSLVPDLELNIVAA
jgi:hypothetical protein